MSSNDFLPQLLVSVLDFRCVEGELSVVEVAGPLTARTCSALREPLRNLHERAAARVLVDLSGVTFIDAAGFGVLVGALRRTQLTDAGWELSFVDRGGVVSTKARLTGLARLLGLAARSTTGRPTGAIALDGTPEAAGVTPPEASSAA